MKKSISRILVGGATLALIMGAMTVPTLAAGYPAVNNGYTAQQNYIGEARAKEIALNHAGLNASQVTWIFVKQDYDYGRVEYEVEFLAGNKEYDYDIDATTGDILSFDQDIEWYVPGTVNQSNTDIGAEQAKNIALNHAGVNAANVAFIYAEFDYDDGMRVYDVEFFAGNKEYDYKIDAASGAILGYDYDIEWYTISTTANDYIGEARAKQIVEQTAGTTGIYTDFKMEVDDGRVLYEGEMKSGWVEYEFEIDAVSGTILDWDVDWD